MNVQKLNPKLLTHMMGFLEVESFGIATKVSKTFRRLNLEKQWKEFAVRIHFEVSDYPPPRKVVVLHLRKLNKELLSYLSSRGQGFEACSVITCVFEQHAAIRLKTKNLGAGRQLLYWRMPFSEKWDRDMMLGAHINAEEEDLWKLVQARFLLANGVQPSFQALQLLTHLMKWFKGGYDIYKKMFPNGDRAVRLEQALILCTQVLTLIKKSGLTKEYLPPPFLEYLVEFVQMFKSADVLNLLYDADKSIFDDQEKWFRDAILYESEVAITWMLDKGMQPDDEIVKYAKDSINTPAGPAIYQKLRLARLAKG